MSNQRVNNLALTLTEALNGVPRSDLYWQSSYATTQIHSYTQRPLGAQFDSIAAQWIEDWRSKRHPRRHSALPRIQFLDDRYGASRIL